ncbi:MAG: hypothetical protein IIW52_09015 [Alistipes sp.]|nr:hypothetical protein [Alistipes sp.]
MKSWLKYILTIAAALSCTTLLTTSCLQSDFDEPLLAGDTAKVSFSLGLDDEITTRAGEGNSIDQLLVAVYNNSTGELVGANNTEAQIVNGNQIKGNFTIELLVGQSYQAVFFAHHDGAYTFSEDYKTISIATYNVDNPEYLDAFYGTKTFSVVASKNTISHELKRPFGLLVFGVKEDNFMENSTAEIKLEGVPTSFNALDGTVSTSTTTQTLNFTPDSTIKVGDNYQGYVLLGMAYVLPSTVTPTLTLSVGGVPQDSKSLNPIAIVANKRYNLLGNSLFVVDNWGGVVTMSGLPEENVSSDGWIHIKTAHELAYVLEKGDDVKIEKQSASLSSTRAEEAKPELIDVTNPKYHICNDIDISKWAEQTSTARFTENVVICGGNWGENTTPTVGGTPTNDDKKYFTVKGLDMTANGIFGDVANFTLQNFRVEDCTMTAPESNPVGMIAGTVTGSLTLTNVSIDGGEVKGSSKVGGLIGYIESSTNSVATLTNCASSAIITATATDYAGALVGCFKGNDASETLNFKSCYNLSESNFNTSFCEAEQACFNVYDEVTETGVYLESYNEHLLGGEELCRGTINYDDVRFFYRWDGKRTVEPLKADPNRDANVTQGTNNYVIYSPYDLAGLRKKTASPSAIYIRQNIDMNGQGVDGKYNVPSNFTKSTHTSTDDNVFNPFNYVTTLDGTKTIANGVVTEQYGIYNLSISQIEQERAAFILYASGNTSHKNINFVNCCTVAVHKPVQTDAKAYGAIVCANIDATYTMENVHATGCKVFALQKVGTLAARVSGTSTLKNCTVNNCYIENYDCNISERFESGPKSMAGFTIDNVYADFYPYGEVGGMFGFIQGNSTLSNCKVNGSEIDAFGQDDKMAEIKASGWKGAFAVAGVKGFGYYKVPGRHVSTLIGDIRATGTVTLTGCSVDANTKCTNRHDKHNSTYTYIGQAYIVKFVDSEGSVTVDGKKLTVADCNKWTTL